MRIDGSYQYTAVLLRKGSGGTSSLANILGRIEAGTAPFLRADALRGNVYEFVFTDIAPYLLSDRSKETR